MPADPNVAAHGLMVDEGGGRSYAWVRMETGQHGFASGLTPTDAYALALRNAYSGCSTSIQDTAAALAGQLVQIATIPDLPL